MLKSHRSLCVAFPWTGAGLCKYHMLVWSNLNFLHISQWITLPTQSCLALYSLSANLHYYYYYYYLRIFSSCVSLWFFTGFWVIASCFQSPGVLPVFQPGLNTVVFMVFTILLISKSSSPFAIHLRIVPFTPITICISVTFMFHTFILFAGSSYLTRFSISFNFILWSAEKTKSISR